MENHPCYPISGAGVSSFLAFLDEGQGELLYYPSVGGCVGVSKMLKFLR